MDLWIDGWISLVSLNEFNVSLVFNENLLFHLRREGNLLSWWILNKKVYQNFDPDEW